ncbi:spore cortex biosynthesis protein YabQ [Numidum massiliense]|uniref:spore cortex biosynthesis protein YabQ n=1 Tax=Numidum massiliense TaxID=1522315 RepID=UPI0006D5A3CC|nr:spore cortex biosynthesis protein YabQ [Numidum massiliense]
MNAYPQWQALAAMLGSGLLLGSALDLYRVLKGKLRITGWVVAIVDLCYWVLAACWIFGVLLWSTWGDLRFYMLLTLFFGIGLYYLWFSRTTIAVLLVVIQIVQQLTRLFVNVLRVLIWIPLTSIALFCWTIVKFLLRITFAAKLLQVLAGKWQQVKNVLLRRK